jgi:hypothetical protein
VHVYCYGVGRQPDSTEIDVTVSRTLHRSGSHGGEQDEGISKFLLKDCSKDFESILMHTSKLVGCFGCQEFQVIVE